MGRTWPKELTKQLAEMIADCISKYNVGHAARANITQDQKLDLEDALRGVFGDSKFRLSSPRNATELKPSQQARQDASGLNRPGES